MAMTESKVLSLEELAGVVAEHKAAGRQVVLCHGVFDLVHPGHIRHFEHARREGDVLVVTVTPDRFVNKGPGRPVFNEALRAQSVAALELVDHVAVNEWPTAVETIGRLRPDVYVKGGEYEQRDADVTGGIFEEERAVLEVGGRIHFTHDVTFSSSHLLNAHFEVFSPEAEAFLEDFRLRHSAGEIVDLLKSFAGLSVLVVGDAIIDEYDFCRAYGMASKSATIAAQLLHHEAYVGGAMAIANHLAGFCDRVDLVTCLGGMDTREDFIRSSLKANVEPTFHVRPDGPTTVKRRYVHHFLVTKLFEVAEFNDEPLPADVSAEVERDLASRLGDYDVVLVADFGQGFLNQKAIETIVSRSRFVGVNAQTNAINLGYNPVTRYPRANYVCIDAEEAHLAYGERHAPLDDVVEALTAQLDPQVLTITRGQNGSLVRARTGETAVVPVFSREVVDTIGAGDAFLALTAPCAHAGAPPEVIGFVGNAVGALAVRIVGNKESVEAVPLYKFVSTLLS
jgi:rfaE bifunctional protein nucleotidyltransferase chain/domain